MSEPPVGGEEGHKPLLVQHQQLQVLRGPELKISKRRLREPRHMRLPRKQKFVPPQHALLHGRHGDPWDPGPAVAVVEVTNGGGGPGLGLVLGGQPPQGRQHATPGSHPNVSLYHTLPTKHHEELLLRRGPRPALLHNDMLQMVAQRQKPVLGQAGKWGCLDQKFHHPGVVHQPHGVDALVKLRSLDRRKRTACLTLDRCIPWGVIDQGLLPELEPTSQHRGGHRLGRVGVPENQDLALHNHVHRRAGLALPEHDLSHLKGLNLHHPHQLHEMRISEPFKIVDLQPPKDLHKRPPRSLRLAEHAPGHPPGLGVVLHLVVAVVPHDGAADLNLR
mmetsp:Transcript_131926/g.299919  ORF Transcript_131926/g.299919 Transcript_131926/m.299919 type:complete len:333 (-) Transcript_131926:277-1275(-)